MLWLRCFVGAVLMFIIWWLVDVYKVNKIMLKLEQINKEPDFSG